MCPLNHHFTMSTPAKDRIRNHIRIPKIFRPSYKYPLAWPLCDVEFGRPKLDPQAKSPLFNKMSSELRVFVYRVVLTDPHRFLHIIKNLPHPIRKKRARRSVAHFWCENMEVPYPTWQHDACYGEYTEVRPSGCTLRRDRPVTETNDNLLSLLLTCRAM